MQKRFLLIKNESDISVTSGKSNHRNHMLCFVENKIYKHRDAGIKFAKLSNYICKQFPHQELENLKYIVRGKVLFKILI